MALFQNLFFGRSIFFFEQLKHVSKVLYSFGVALKKKESSTQGSRCKYPKKHMHPQKSLRYEYTQC